MEMKTVTLGLVLVFCVYTSNAFHRIEIFKKYKTYSSINEHIQELTAKYGFNDTMSKLNFNRISYKYNFPLKNFQSTAYYGVISLGEGSQKQCFQAEFDTGSSNTWFPGPKCTSGGCINHKSFDCDKSSTCQSSGKSYDLKYREGQVSGELVHETFCFGCDSSGPCVKQQALVLSKSETATPFFSKPFDGMVGLAFDNLAIPGTNTPISGLMLNDHCPEGVFAFWMNHDPNCQSGGELTICGIDPERYWGSLVWTPVIEAKYWQFSADYISVKGRRISSHIRVSVSTGSPLIVGHRVAIESIYDQLGIHYNATIGPGIIYCEDGDGLANFVISISGREFIIEPKDYLIRNLSTGLCTVPFVGQTDAGDLWILGDAFLSSVYTVFDMEHKRLGFSLSRCVPSELTSTPPSAGTQAGLNTLIKIVALILAITVKLV